MPAVADREQLRSEELFEAALTGPFGGIQSELPLTQIEALGFANITNFILRIGSATPRPGFTALPPMPAPLEPILGAANFSNINGNLVQCIFTPTRLIQYLNGNWVVITGPTLHGSSTGLYSWDVLNYKLCFANGVDGLMLWDGVSASFGLASANAPSPALYVAEVATHLIVISPAFPMRYYWSGIGDPTSWNQAVDFTTGLSDIVNNLGPINGVKKVGQYGFGHHQKGIIQIIATGIGIAPFSFIPIVNANQGAFAPYSLANIDNAGQEQSAYLGIDNVYLFNGSSIESIGDRPLGDGSSRRYGARSQILQDVSTGTLKTIQGFCTYSINGRPFRAYWLNIPGVALWVYNFDEGNWTVFTYTNVVQSIADFFIGPPLRIADLIGSIGNQRWSPATLQGASPFTGFLLGFANGTAGYVDFTTYSELPCVVTSGKLIMADRRHKRSLKKFRLAFTDLGQTTFTITVMNEKNQTESHSFTIGSGSGDDLSYVQEFNITGLRLQYTVSVPSFTKTSILEFAPIYDTSGEQRGGTVEN